jgi:hypothetical protein
MLKPIPIQGSFGNDLLLKLELLLVMNQPSRVSAARFGLFDFTDP